MKKTVLLSLLFVMKTFFVNAQTVTAGCPWDGIFSSTIGSGMGDTNYAGESITPGISGTITQIKFWYSSSGSQSGDGMHTAVLYLAQNPDTGSITNIIDTFEFPTGINYPNGLSAYTYTFSTPYPVSAGITYRFEIRNSAGNDNFGLWFVTGESDRYAGGQGYYGGSPIVSSDYTDMFFEYTMTSTPLPLMLTGFEATRQGNAAALSWTTATEKDNIGFEVERNTDGSRWATIGFVKSQAEDGNSSMQLDYKFTDNAPADGRNMYRLKQISYGGSNEYSTVRTLNFSSGNNLYIYPNPAKQDVTITGLQGNENINMYDVTGRHIRTVKTITPSLIIDLGNLADGIYSIRITSTNGKVSLHRVIKSH